MREQAAEILSPQPARSRREGGDCAGSGGGAALLIEERAGRREAARRALRVMGTLAVLEEAGRRGLVDFAAALRQLPQTSFRLSPALLEPSRSPTVPSSEPVAEQRRVV